jgi:hypothetical protein
MKAGDAVKIFNVPVVTQFGRHHWCSSAMRVKQILRRVAPQNDIYAAVLLNAR